MYISMTLSEVSKEGKCSIFINNSLLSSVEFKISNRKEPKLLLTSIEGIWISTNEYGFFYIFNKSFYSLLIKTNSMSAFWAFYNLFYNSQFESDSINKIPAGYYNLLVNDLSNSLQPVKLFLSI